ncbi:hypothetical protein G5I_04598 [Acromyrmex echinatior]|uniref:Uncharacterized protein n=1 Tax=Acromyrmex echinatior TaxID=103372 RepID=F4WG26_ACREC|nr:hypothetical protein G5I_04598 [Acromyrmex echinatior]
MKRICYVARCIMLHKPLARHIPLSAGSLWRPCLVEPYCSAFLHFIFQVVPLTCRSLRKGWRVTSQHAHRGLCETSFQFPPPCFISQPALAPKLPEWYTRDCITADCITVLPAKTIRQIEFTPINAELTNADNCWISDYRAEISQGRNWINAKLPRRNVFSGVRDLYKTRKKKSVGCQAEKLAPEEMINIGARVRDWVIRGFFRTVKESAMGVASGRRGGFIVTNGCGTKICLIKTWHGQQPRTPFGPRAPGNEMSTELACSLGWSLHANEGNVRCGDEGWKGHERRTPRGTLRWRMEELETLESTECPECPGPPPEFRLPPPPRPPFLTEGTFCSESPLAELEDCVAIPMAEEKRVGGTKRGGALEQPRGKVEVNTIKTIIEKTLRLLFKAFSSIAHHVFEFPT